MFDTLGDRMKFYESLTGIQLIPCIPVVVRLDGKNFHSFTRGLRKPFDTNLIDLMVATAKFLIEETNALVAFTQSDEISLVLHSIRRESPIYFNGKTHKINSVLASKCSVFFNKKLVDFLPEKADTMPVFDCRCFNVPNLEEAYNALKWRQLDAVRNSIQMVGQFFFSHKTLHGKSCDEILKMLAEKAVNWHDFPSHCKNGVCLKREVTYSKFVADVDVDLPPKHHARTNPDMMIRRVKIVESQLDKKCLNDQK